MGEGTSTDPRAIWRMDVGYLMIMLFRRLHVTQVIPSSEP